MKWWTIMENIASGREASPICCRLLPPSRPLQFSDTTARVPGTQHGKKTSHLPVYSPASRVVVCFYPPELSRPLCSQLSVASATIEKN